MAIALGGNQINKAYLGGTEIQKMYLGGDLVFDNSIQPSELTPIMTNFRILDGIANRVYFDTPLGPVTGLTTQGFTISGVIQITSVNTTDNYFTIATGLNFWDQAMTIRLENGNGVVYDFTMESIYNEMDEPTATTIKYVDNVGGGNGDSVGSPWSVSQANAASEGTTIYVKVGQYNDVTWNPNNNGTASNPIKFVGYKTTPGDLDNVWIKDVFDYVDTANANTYMDPAEWPLFTGVNTNGSSGIRLTQDYLIIKNIQVEHYHYNIWSSSGNYISIQNTTAANGYDTIAENVGSGFYYGNTRVFNCRTYKCVSFDNSGQNYYYRGEYHLFENNSSWGGDNEGNRPVDYYLNGYDCSFNVIKNNYVERSAPLSHGGHGIGFKNSNTGCEYNLIIGNDVRGLRGEIYYAAHQDTAYNVFKENYTYGADGDSAVLIARNGAHHNLYENNKGEHCKYAVYLWANSEDQPIVSGNAAADNIFRNNMFIEMSSCVTTSNSNATTYAIKDNQIYGNTFYEEKATVQGVFWSTETTGHALTYSGNTFKNNLLVNLDMPLYADFAEAGEFAITYGNFFNNQFAMPAGEGNAALDPQFNNITDLIPTNDALIACPQLDNYDYSGDQRFNPTTYGGEINPNEQGVAPPVTDYDFYVSATGTGDGLTEGSPMSFADSQTTINSMTAGQSIAYKGGDSFFGSLTVSGRTGITITSYGTGKASITGTKDITGWTNQGGNIWTASTGTDTAYQVFKNKVALTNARTPLISSSDAYSGNYHQVTGGSGTVFSCSALPDGVDLNGASIHCIGTPWFLDTRTIVAYDIGTKTFTLSSSVGGFTTGDDFCVNNNAGLLTVQDYWHYSSGTLSIYSTTEPTGISINTLNSNGIGITTSSDVTLDNIEVFGFRQYGVYVTTSTGISILNSDILYNYARGISLEKGGVENNYATIDNCNVTGGDFGVRNYSDYTTLTNSTFTEIGTALTMTGSGYGISTGMYSQQPGATITGNRFINSGYSGILVNGENSVIQNNFFDGYCLIKHDGGAIYAWNGDYADTGPQGTLIDHNIILTPGNPGSWALNPIYMDDRIHDITITYNSVQGGSNSLFLHNNKRTELSYNKVYESHGNNIFLSEDSAGGAGGMVDNVITYNDLFTRNTDVNNNAGKYRTQYSTYENLATYDNNVYYSTEVLNCIIPIDSGAVNRFTLAQWQADSGQDLNSSTNTSVWTGSEESQFIYNDTGASVDVVLVGIWEDLRENSYDSTITLAPYSGEILIQASGGDTYPLNPGNVILDPNDLTTANWTGGMTSSSTTLAPDGTQSKVMPFDDDVVYQDSSAMDVSDVWTIDLWIKGNQAGTVKVRKFDNTDLTVNVTTEWQQVQIVRVPVDGGATSVRLLIDGRISSGVGNPGLEIAVFNAQSWNMDA